VIAGGAAISSGLLTYNIFNNPQWIRFGSFKPHPLYCLLALSSYAAFNSD
jgi:hypothetical protein